MFPKKDVLGPDALLYVWGKIRYKDIGGETEENSFCRYITGFLRTPEGDAPGGFGPYGYDRGNYIGGIGEDCPETDKH
jgi:hypothetical protein